MSSRAYPIKYRWYATRERWNFFRKVCRQCFKKNRLALELLYHAKNSQNGWLQFTPKIPSFLKRISCTKSACEVISGYFILISFHDKNSTPLARRVMKGQLQLKDHDWLSSRTLKLYERGRKRCFNVSLI